MRFVRFLLLFFVSIFITAPSFVFAEEYKSAIDYIQKTNRLYGISECRLNKDKSITLVDSQSGIPGYALKMRDGKGGFLNQITLIPEESCELIDRHLRITYKYIGIKDGQIVIEITERFDARSFGGEDKEQTRTVAISPYHETQTTNPEDIQSGNGKAGYSG